MTVWGSAHGIFISLVSFFNLSKRNNQPLLLSSRLVRRDHLFLHMLSVIIDQEKKTQNDSYRIVSDKTELNVVLYIYIF